MKQKKEFETAVEAEVKEFAAGRPSDIWYA
jgi:hypothetical protein